MPLSKLITPLFACLLLALTASSAQAYAPFQMGIYDPISATQPGTSAAATNFQRMQDASASLTRITVEWKEVAPVAATKPAGFDGANPSDPAYAWGPVDAFVRAAAAHGLDPIITTSSAPSWAEGNSDADRAKRKGEAYTYNPNPKEYGNFGTALATRYSGKFPDPLNPGTNLPKVRYYQVWNEPNFGDYLTSTSKKAVPIQYAKMLSSFSAAVKKVSGSNLIITAGLGPYGNNGHANDIEPQEFMRTLFCLTGSGGKNLGVQKNCKVPKPRFDIWSQHPYTFGGTPTTKAGAPDSAAMGNMPDVRRTLDYAMKVKHISSKTRLWSTEMAWFSNPPGIVAGDGRQLGEPLATQAAYLSETAYRMWRLGFSAMVWYGVDDQAGFPGGLYLGSGESATPKPALDAFKFPFYADYSSGKVLFWGLAHGAGKVKIRIEKKSGSSFKKLADVRADSQGMIYRRITAGKGTYRATVLSGARKGLVSLEYKGR